VIRVSSSEELLPFLHAQRKVEDQIVDSLTAAVKGMRNLAVKAVLTGISMDSLKHAAMYDAAVQLLTTVTPALTDQELSTQRELVKAHIRLEADLIARISSLLPRVADAKVKLLLSAILADEEKHHRLLETVLENLIRRETMTEEDWWDLLWKGAPIST